MTFSLTPDIDAAAWIRDAVLPWVWETPPGMTLASLVPGGYRRLVAVPNDPAIPWALADADPETRPEGTLDAARWRTLAGIVEDVHGRATPVTVGQWTGYGHIVTSSPAPAPQPSGLAQQRSFGWVSSFTVEAESLSLLELPHREYALFRGTTSTLRSVDWQRESGWAWASADTVDLCWPDDRTWFAYSDTDLTQLYLACGDTLADRVLCAELDATTVEYSDAPR